MANFSCHASINIFMLQQFFSFDNGLGTIWDALERLQ
jgi:hypothetical protein